MPTISKIAEFTITPTQFLDACSPVELKELEVLLYSNRYQEKMNANQEKMNLNINQQKLTS